MPIADLFENFSENSSTDKNAAGMSEDELEDIRLAAFEKGYVAGWEDAIKNQEKENSRISDGMSQRLEDISFTFYEARSQFSKDSGIILRLLSEKILPETLHRNLAEHLTYEMKSILESLSPDSLTIAVPKGNRTKVEKLLNLDISVPLRIEEDFSLSNDQVVLRVADIEREIDINRFVKSMLDTMDTFTFSTEKSDKYG
ncbi:hypothetical protein GI582_11760 [Sulfitobacter sp. BDSS02]|nr:hypothetical protein [Sulfitobacter sp. BDSS02]MBR9848587.1 hypothetical protein [Paracoccaceae bacterium]